MISPRLHQYSSPNFKWGNIDGCTFSTAIDFGYREVVYCKQNVFDVPSFVHELTHLFNAYSDVTLVESIAVTAVMTMPHLPFQKPHPSSKACQLSHLLNGDVKGR